MTSIVFPTGLDAVMVEMTPRQTRLCKSPRPAPVLEPMRYLRNLAALIGRYDDLALFLLATVVGGIATSSTASLLLLSPLDEARLPDADWPIEPPTCRPPPVPLDEVTRGMLNIPADSARRQAICQMVLSEAIKD